MPYVISLDRSEPGVAVVGLEGEHEAFDAPRLERQVQALIRERLAIVVDLSRATFLDSTTLTVLMKARRDAADRGLGFALQMEETTGEYVYRTFELTRLTSVFPIYGDRSDAVAAARAHRAAPDPGVETA